MAREGLDIIDEEGIIQFLGIAKVFDDWTKIGVMCSTVVELVDERWVF